MTNNKTGGILFVFMSLQLLALNPVCAAGPGTASADFLKIPVGVRETALGGAFTAVADNANAVYYNPAGLGRLQKAEVSFTYNKYLDGVSQQWLAAALPYKSGAFGLGLNYLNIGAFNSYDNSGNPTGSVSACDMAAYLSYGGRALLDYGFPGSVSYGAGVKYISSRLDTEKAGGWGLDLGLMFTPGSENLRFGFGVDNLVATRMRFINEGDSPSLKYKAGMAYKAGSAYSALEVLFLADAYFPENGSGYAAGGIEALLYRVFALRAGYSSFGDISNGFNFGLGFDLAQYMDENLRLDYSFGSTYDFGDIHKFGITYKFGGRAPRPADSVRRRRPTHVRASPDLLPRRR